MFSENLLQLRTERRFTRRDVADAADVGVEQIRRYERGYQQPTLAVALRIADFFGVSIEELADDQEGDAA